MAPTLPRFYYFANDVLRRVLFPLLRISVTVEGEENVPREGGLLVAANHLSMLDPPVLGAVVPRDLTFMSKQENFEINPLFSWIVRNYGAFPVRRGEGDVTAFKQALRVVKEGGALFMAPEGTRSKSATLGEPHDGLALIALRSGAPILPIGISGVEQFTSKLARWRPIRARVTIGKPFRLISPARKPDPATLQGMSVAVMERIAELLPPSYRGPFGHLTDNQRYVQPIDPASLLAPPPSTVQELPPQGSDG